MDLTKQDENRIMDSRKIYFSKILHWFKGISGLVAILFLFELFIRYAVISPANTEPDPELGWRYRPHTSILKTDEGFARNTTNSYGFNDEEFALTDKMRILVLGDSFSEALHVDHSQNFTSIVEKNYPCTDVINAGRSGMTILHYPIVLSRLYEKVPLDLAVVVFSDGDMDDLVKRSSLFELDREPTTNKIRDLHFRESPLHDLRIYLDPILSHSALAYYLMVRSKEWLEGRKESSAVPSGLQSEGKKIDPEEIIEFTLGKLTSKVPIVIMFIPSIDYFSNQLSVETQRSKTTSDALQAIAQRLDIPFLSVTPFLQKSYEMTGNPPVGFPNKDIMHGHLNLRGHLVVGDALSHLVSLDCHNIYSRQ